MPTVGCFDAAAFQRLLEGQVAVPELDYLASHLGQCPRCSRLVQNLPEVKLAALANTVTHLPAQSVEAARLKTLLQQILNLRGNVETLDQLSAASHVGEVAPAPQPAAPQASAAPSQFIGRYRIVRELGRGGMGTVYEAEDGELRRRVAIKVPQFSGSAAHQDMMRQRFLREARAAAAVEHQYVCKIHDVGEQAGVPFVVMAFVEGPSLAGRMAQLRKVNDRSAVALVLRIAEALLAVHDKGIIHRDLKPANILLPKDGTPILTDFGLAHIHADSAHLTGEGALLGTPAYMAPEQAVPELGPVTVRTDLYSLGVILFQLLTGRLPIEGDVMRVLAHHLARKSAPAPAQFRPEMDPVLDGIVRKAMEFQPQDRYPDVLAFAHALRDWARGSQSAAAPRVDSVAEKPAPGPSAQATSPALAAPQPATMAQPAPHPTVPALPSPSPVLPPSATVVPAPVPVRTEKAGGLRWWHIAAALLLLGGGVAIGIVVVGKNPGTPTAQNKDSQQPGKTTDDRKSGPEQTGSPKASGPIEGELSGERKGYSFFFPHGFTYASRPVTIGKGTRSNTGFGTTLPVKLKSGDSLSITATVKGTNRFVALYLFDSTKTYIGTAGGDDKKARLTIPELSVTGTYTLVIFSEQAGPFTVVVESPTTID